MDCPTVAAAHGVKGNLFCKAEKTKKMMEKTEMIGKTRAARTTETSRTTGRRMIYLLSA